MNLPSNPYILLSYINTKLRDQYSSLDDFLSKVKLTKPQMVNLIKSGAFDEFGDSRDQVMNDYIDKVADKKKRITLQNMAMLIKYSLIPKEYEHQIKVFNFNKYLKKFKNGIYYELDDNTYRFYSEHYDVDKLNYENGVFKVNQAYWSGVEKM